MSCINFRSWDDIHRLWWQVKVENCGFSTCRGATTKSQNLMVEVAFDSYYHQLYTHLIKLLQVLLVGSNNGSKFCPLQHLFYQIERYIEIIFGVGNGVNAAYLSI